jgi:hypothetical protein
VPKLPSNPSFLAWVNISCELGLGADFEGLNGKWLLRHHPPDTHPSTYIPIESVRSCQHPHIDTTSDSVIKLGIIKLIINAWGGEREERRGGQLYYTILHYTTHYARPHTIIHYTTLQAQQSHRKRGGHNVRLRGANGSTHSTLN